MVEQVDAMEPTAALLARTMEVVIAGLSDLELAGMSALASANYEDLILNLTAATLFPSVARAISRPATDCGSAAVSHARDYIHAHATRPIELSRLAADVGVSMRAMQENFQRHYGLSPREYLMSCRLESARRRLTAAASGSSVTSIAYDSGFSDLSHFSAKYREKYGELPSETLRFAQRRMS